MSPAASERRKHPRAPGRSKLRMQAGKVDCTVVDISCSGIRFQSPNALPEMSLVEIRLEVPCGVPNGPDEGCEEVRGEGAVVRDDELGDGLHDVAVFFTRLDDRGRLTLMNYVRQHD